MKPDYVVVMTYETLFEPDSIPAVRELSELGVDLPYMIPYYFDEPNEFPPNRFLYGVRENIWNYVDVLMCDEDPYSEDDPDDHVRMLMSVLEDVPIAGKKLSDLVMEMADAMIALNLPPIFEATVEDYVPGEEITIFCYKNPPKHTLYR